MAKIKIGPQTLLYPMPAVLVGSIVDGRANFMTAAWCAIASHKPPAVAVALKKSRHTLKGIRETRVFSVNVPSTDLVEKVDRCGLYSGEKRDKSTLFSLFTGELAEAPLVEECPVNLECRVMHLLDVGSHDLVVGEIVETHILEEAWRDGKVDVGRIDPLVYAPSARDYHRLGEKIAPAYQVGKERGQDAG